MVSPRFLALLDRSSSSLSRSRTERGRRVRRHHLGLDRPAHGGLSAARCVPSLLAALNGVPGADGASPSASGLKLLIALSDRYALGFWATDCYATHLNIVQPGSSGAQKVADASSFYTDKWAISMFQKRLAHIMAHPNSLMGGKTWAELDSVILAVERELSRFRGSTWGGSSR